MLTNTNTAFPAELHEMFALVAARFLGTDFKIVALEQMMDFKMGMVTHMRPIVCTQPAFEYVTLPSPVDGVGF
jgi:hypothetical protein